jgi:hypothetical protein
MSPKPPLPAKEAELSWRPRLFSWIVRALRGPARIGIALVGRLGVRYARLLSLRGIASRALERGDHDTAARLARELLALVEKYRSDWYYGNAIQS